MPNKLLMTGATFTPVDADTVAASIPVVDETGQPVVEDGQPKKTYFILNAASLDAKPVHKSEDRADHKRQLELDAKRRKVKAATDELAELEKVPAPEKSATSVKETEKAKTTETVKADGSK